MFRKCKHSSTLSMPVLENANTPSLSACHVQNMQTLHHFWHAMFRKCKQSITLGMPFSENANTPSLWACRLQKMQTLHHFGHAVSRTCRQPSSIESNNWLCFYNVCGTKEWLKLCLSFELIQAFASLLFGSRQCFSHGFSCQALFGVPQPVSFTVFGDLAPCPRLLYNQHIPFGSICGAYGSETLESQIASHGIVLASHESIETQVWAIGARQLLVITHVITPLLVITPRYNAPL
jgi:hypothetical protein